jgi:SAM-dependent methyltransferase
MSTCHYLRTSAESETDIPVDGSAETEDAGMDMQSTFDMLADRYDLLIDWPKRMAGDAHFLETLFKRKRVQRVADVACGTGHHAALFHAWGLDVEGSDISDAMLVQCRRLHGEGNRLRWIQRSYVDPCSSPGSFDAVVCLGNSLLLAGSLSAAQGAIGEMIRAVRPGGIGVVQVLNLAAIECGPVRWQKVMRIEVEGRPRLFIKCLHRSETQAFVDFLEVDVSSEPVQWQSRSEPLLLLSLEWLTKTIQQAGSEVESVHGSLGESVFDPAGSNDMVVVWRRIRGAQERVT